MRIEKASSFGLITWMLLAAAIVALFVTLLLVRGNAAGLIGGLLFVPFAAVAMATAWMLDDTEGPILEADERGMRVSSVFTTGETIPWSDIEKLSVASWHYNIFFRVPFMSWLIVRLRDSSHIAPWQWFFPPAWFGRLAIPTRFMAGGRDAALVAVARSQLWVFEGEIARERANPATQRMFDRGDAAIERALAARRGGTGPQAQPRTMADPATGGDAPAAPPRQPIPQGYGEEPEAAPFAPARPAPEPIATLQQPAPIIVNGVPYQPKPVGGFGRKRV